MSKTYYKILTKNLESLTAEEMKGSIGDCSIQYKLNKWVFPKILGSSLFVFRNKFVAQSFISTYSGYYGYKFVVYKVEVGSIYRNVISVNLSGLMKKKLLDILKKKRNKKRFLYLLWKGIPLGTVGVEKVKLIEYMGTTEEFKNCIAPNA